MSWFKKNKSQPLIPPVEASPALNRGSTSPGSTGPPSYRSSATTYVASRDGDLSDPRAYGNTYRQNCDGPAYNGAYRQNSDGSVYGEPNRPNYGRQHSDPGIGYNDDSMQPPPVDRYSDRNEYGATSVVSDPYRRGERDLDADRNALFAGSAPPSETPRDRFYDGPTAGRPPPTTGEENEEDVDEVIKQTRFLKQDTVQTTRNALRIAREAEEVGRSTLLRLGEQSEKIADTERHIDVAKGHALRAEDNADEIKKLNRSIFIPAVTFNKDAKRLAQERKREQRYQEEMTERELTMQEVRDSQNRVGRGATFGFQNSEGIAGRRQMTSTELAMRKEQRKRYQFEATESDDEMENEIEDNLDEILDATKRMKALGLSMGSELETQNQRLVRVTDKTDRLGMKVDINTAKLNRIVRRFWFGLQAMARITEAERERLANIERNKKLLEELGLDDVKNTMLATKPKPQPPAKESKKRKPKKDEMKENEQDDEEGRPRKSARVVEATAESNGLRRSRRNTGKKIDYAVIEQDRSARTYRVATYTHVDMEGEPRSVNKRTQNPKQYGHIPGVDIGAWWETREACSLDAIHAPWVAGISPGPQGAYSIALSGGYDDDVDLGNGFTFTGSGGRDLKGTKDKPKNLRTAPQSSDQTFENHFNKSLLKSSQTKRPVRVIRGYKSHSPFAPVEGYRYDGLYTVEKAWQEIGVNTKFLVCKFAFKRLPGQPPLPKRDLDAEAEEELNGNRSSDEDEEDEETHVASTQDTESSTQVDDDAEGENDEEA
ncbi:SEC9 [Sanghuangporus sanghuang]